MSGEPVSEAPPPDVTTGTAARRNRRLGLSLAMLVAGMVMLAYASVPLYRLFCQVTGFGGTTQVAKAGPDRVLARTVKVRFNADVNPALPWKFEPEQNEVEVHVGEEKMIFYRATNIGREPLVGMATYNVSPDKAGEYFTKLECFCFREQRLQPGETVDMPVVFFVDPRIVEDPRAKDVATITLSYTFFQSKLDPKPVAQSAVAPGAATARP